MNDVDRDLMMMLKARKWKTMDQRLIPVGKMSISHIKNARAMMDGHPHPLAEDWVKVFDEELERRSDDTTDSQGH